MAILGGKCNHCGATEKLEFDHIDPKTRTFKMGKILNHRKDEALEEIKKCQLLCRPCHTEKSRREGSFKGRPKIEGAVQGTNTP